MKQYKHKLTGIILTKVDHGENYKGIQYYSEDQICIPETILKVSKEWDEIKDKPKWTILSFKEASIMSLDEKTGLYSWSKQDKAEGHGHKLEFLLAKKWSIHSVRRESDGEVFTVGDIVNHPENPNELAGRIFEIKIINDFILIRFNKENNCSNSLTVLRKVKPKEWEITAFKKNNCIVPTNGVKYWIDVHLENKDEIYSVKRLSDGVEFKIGDKVDLCHGLHIIKQIELIAKTNNIRFSCKKIKTENGWGNRSHECKCTVLLQNAKLVKEKLFTTEDGVDIYEGDKYWCVNSNLFSTNPNKVDIIAFSDQEMAEDNPTHYDWIKKFSTKEAADEYILMNKPCLSIKDLNELQVLTQLNEKRVMDFVKSKLGL